MTISQERRSRPSKLKRKRKNNGNLAAARSDASRPWTHQITELKDAVTAGIGSATSQGSTQEENNPSFNSPCQILNISTSDVDQCRMNCSFEKIHTSISQNDETNNHSLGDGDERVGISMTHDILGNIGVGYCPQNINISNGVKKNHGFMGAFPLKTRVVLSDDTKGRTQNFFRRTNPYRRGDGDLINYQSLVFPTMIDWKHQNDDMSVLQDSKNSTETTSTVPISKGDSSLSKAKGTLKIVSQHGATIRQDYNINDSTDSECIGKLSNGEVRNFIRKEWLPPPPPDPFEEDELDDLTGVYRYQIQLLQADHAGKNQYFGWISDRSRLKEDPYKIIEVLSDF
jgi:hypothetical protein